MGGKILVRSMGQIAPPATCVLLHYREPQVYTLYHSHLRPNVLRNMRAEWTQHQSLDLEETEHK